MFGMQFLGTMLPSIAVLLSLGRISQSASCSPGRAFPIPSYSSVSLKGAFESIFDTVSEYFTNDAFHATNVAVEVTSTQETLWSFYHAAKNQSSQAGSIVIGPDTVFRVARVSKLLTAMAVLQLHDQGHITSLHDPIELYIPELKPSKVEWERITIWDLLNNVAGILDMCLYSSASTRYQIDPNLLSRWLCRYLHGLSGSSKS